MWSDTCWSSAHSPIIVSGFTFPVAVVYTGDSTISTSVLDVLSARSAFLPDAVISSILSQLNVNITYEPLECKKVSLMPAK
ncbi:hypothetical protein KIN20_031852 [Parelaphostrongylus tenuis]|uniref:Uncharacterized protein n=1 Tax=Parelaphostrongylus tenuis TaxID=148309 RepID=A0AAD5R5P3_PARTN|nr:hypothetical protein KIN20_031852 [Parelaphostrongylus tenuis]